MMYDPAVRSKDFDDLCRPQESGREIDQIQSAQCGSRSPEIEDVGVDGHLVPLSSSGLAFGHLSAVWR
jgi:hypothetical protein